MQTQKRNGRAKASQLCGVLLWELLRHSGKDHWAELIAEAIGLLRVSRFAETLGKLKKLLLFALLGIDAVLDQPR